MTGVRRATVRYGTLRIAVSLADGRYARAFDTHLRTLLHPEPSPGDAVDLRLEVTDEPATDQEVDALTIERDGDRTTWRTPAGAATREGADARLVMRPGAVGGDQLLFWFTVLVQKVLLAVGLVRLHAGAVTTGDRTLVFVGEKGAGKSTLALALGQRGATALGDDQLAVQTEGGSVIVAGSYPSIRLTAETERQLLDAPLDVEPVVLAGVAKKEVALEALVPASPYVGHRPTHLWFPQVGARFEAVPIRRSEALERLVRAVAPHHRFADHRDRADLLDVLSRLVAAAQPTAVTLSPDLSDLDLAWAELRA